MNELAITLPSLLSQGFKIKVRHLRVFHPVVPVLAGFRLEDTPKKGEIITTKTEVKQVIEDKHLYSTVGSVRKASGIDPTLELKLSPFGGATAVDVKDPVTGNSVETKSLCSMKDVYVKCKGIQYALDRAVKEIRQLIEISKARSRDTDQ